MSLRFAFQKLRTLRMGCNLPWCLPPYLFEPAENDVDEDKSGDPRKCKDHRRRDEEINEEYHHDVFSMVQNEAHHSLRQQG